jgi:hypothetical protein
MPWQPAQSGTIAQDAQGAYHIKVEGQWLPAPKGSIAQDAQGAYHLNSDMVPQIAPTMPSPPPEPEEKGTSAGDVVKGVGDAALSGASKVASGIVGAPIALVNRLVAALTGGDGQEAANAAKDFVNSHFSRDTTTPVGKKIGAAVEGAIAPIGEMARNTGQLLEKGGQAIGLPAGETTNQISELGDIAGSVGLAAPIAAGARASTEAAQLAAQNVPTAVSKYGMQTGAESPIARTMAGGSAKPTVTAHNQSIANPVLAAQAGIAPGQKITPAALEAARAAPDSVYTRAEQNIPTGPLSPSAAQAVQGVGADDMIVHSPDTQATIDAQKARLLSGPLTGSEVVNGQRALRFNGFRNVASEDPETSALGQAQLKMADALHQHMVDTLPPDAPVTADQLSAARVALAQNHTIESVLGPNGDVNLTKLAKIHNDNPNMLTGPMADIAQFASDHPEVTRLPSDAERFNPPGVMHDVASIDLKRPLSYVQPLVGGVARRALTGPRPAINTPVTGLGGEFGPIERGGPQPPPGMTASTPSAAPPAAPPQGGFSLADLLSHGVEQQPEKGLQIGTAPQQEGIPFTQNAEHMAGGLELEPPRTYGGQPANNQDLGHVMSQGVPEGIVQRANNASGESAASLESINRGTRPMVEINPDGNERTVMRDVTQIDARAPKGHLLVDPTNGEIIDRGGLSEAQAKGLRNRWATMGRSLGDNFVYGK